MYTPAFELINWTSAIGFTFAKVQNVGKLNFSKKTNKIRISKQLNLSKCRGRKDNNCFQSQGERVYRTVHREHRQRGRDNYSAGTCPNTHTGILPTEGHQVSHSLLTCYYQLKTKSGRRQTTGSCSKRSKKKHPCMSQKSSWIKATTHIRACIFVWAVYGLGGALSPVWVALYKLSSFLPEGCPFCWGEGLFPCCNSATPT